MALIACPECHQQISDKAAACPKCGAPVPTVGNPDKAMRFHHPRTGTEADLENVWLWVFLFGPIYFAVKGVWTHAAASLLIALITAGFSWLAYPFFARKIMRRHYIASGWTAADAEPHPDTHVTCPDCRGFVRKEAVACPHCGCGLVPQT